MSQSTRKLIGVLLTIAVLVAYSLIVMVLYDTFLTALPQPVLLGFFVVAGLGWCIPAMAIIRWMARPDRS